MKFFQDAVEVAFTGLKHTFTVSSVFCEFSIGGRDYSIKWYGVIIAFGFILAALYGGRRAYTWHMDIGKMLDILFFGTIGGVLGARIYYVIFRWEYYSVHLSEIFKVWHGGLAIYGGVIGGLIAAFITSKVIKLNFMNLLDLAGMSFLIGQGIGRWGNYANQEAFGVNTDSPFGMISAKTTRYILEHQSELPGVDPFKPVHPTFLYESVWCLLGFLVLYLIFKKGRRFSGEIFLSYLIWYGAERAVVEGLRTDSLYFAGTDIRVSQALAAVGAVAAFAALIILEIKFRKNPKPVEGQDYYIEPEPFFKFEKKRAKGAPGEKIPITDKFKDETEKTDGNDSGRISDK